MIDNYSIIKPLLKFDDLDKFYYIQILQRKKENNLLTSNSRVIKNYYISSLEDLEHKYEEMKNLCNLFNARASIRLNRRSYEKLAYQNLLKVTNCIMNKDFKSIIKSYDRTCGSYHSEEDKTWIVDIDIKNPFLVVNLISFISNIEPKEERVIMFLESKSGGHLITRPFNTTIFKEKYPNIDLHKDNPTNLYIP